jgi:NAD(P)-dependent dehydrogenase (short-subunit alcohol dehydrogenase family)
MRTSLNGKVALITGASTGIGLASAHELAARGVRLFIAGRRGSEIADAARAIGRGTVGVQADVSNLTDLDRLYEQISRDAGRLDVVFANAGGGDMLPLKAITADHVALFSPLRMRAS